MRYRKLLNLRLNMIKLHLKTYSNMRSKSRFIFSLCFPCFPLGVSKKVLGVIEIFLVKIYPKNGEYLGNVSRSNFENNLFILEILLEGCCCCASTNIYVHRSVQYSTCTMCSVHVYVVMKHLT